MIRHLFLAALLLSAANFLHAQEADPGDDAVRRAVRASLLGRSGEVHAVSRSLRIDEERADLLKQERLSGNVEALALATERPLPLLGDARRALSDHSRSAGAKSVDRLLRRAEPRQRFLEARKDRRYDDTRRVFNAFASPINSLAQGHFFSLIILPFEAAEHIVTGRPFLTPEQRRELIQARNAVERFTPDVLNGKPAEVARGWSARRRNLAALQARQNGEKALRETRFEVSNYWFDREMELRGWARPERSGHVRARQALNRLAEDARSNVTVIDGYAMLASSAERVDYAHLVSTFIREPESREFAEAVSDFRLDHPGSRVLDAALAAAAAGALARGERDLARIELLELASTLPGAPWGRRAAGITSRPEYRPELLLAEARSAAAGRLRGFIVSAEDPTVMRRSYTPEEARLRRSLWVERARTLFVVDMLARTLFLPFMKPFPRPELLDAAGMIDPEWFNTPRGREWLLEIARANRIERRYASAAAVYTKAGESGMARAMEHKAARHLERLGDRSGDPRESSALYRRILNAYSTYKHGARVEKSLEEAQIRAHSLAIIPANELRSWPELLETARLHPRLVDGKKANGEIGREGLSILDYDAISFVDRQGNRRVELPITTETRAQLLRLYEPRRRSAVRAEELRKPLPRRRIPAAIEAGIFPGFDIAPALVPLDPDLRERELYR